MKKPEKSQSKRTSAEANEAAPVTLSGAEGSSPAAAATGPISKSRSNIQNN